VVELEGVGDVAVRLPRQRRFRPGGGAAEEAGTGPRARVRLSVTRTDLVVGTVFLIGGLWVPGRLWFGSNLRVAASDDENVFEWFLAHGARWVTHGGNPLFSHQILQPEGANLMINTSILGLSVPLAPLTLAVGAHAAFLIAVTLCLAGTSYAWYHVLSRHFVESRLAAFLGAALCGFGPGMVAHSAGQLDLIADFLVPFLVLAVLRLREPGRARRGGIVLGLLAAYQIMIAEEVVFMTGITIAVFLLLYAVQRPGEVRPQLPAFLRGAAVAAVTALVAVGYPLWFQFFGPRHASGLMEGAADWVTPIDQYVSIPPSSFAGNPTFGNAVTSFSEYNSFFGWALPAVLVLIVIWRRRDPVVRALAGAAVVAGLISLGKTITFGEATLGPGPFRALAHLPLFDKLSPSRFGLAVMVVFGVLVALAADRWSAAVGRGELGGLDARTVRVAGYAVLGAALLPLIPAPVMTMEVSGVPAFIASGAWRSYVAPGQSVVVVPVPMYAQTEALRWSTFTRLDLPLAHGYMLGPVGADGTRMDFNPPPRVLSTMLNDAARDGRTPEVITDDQRRAVTADLRYWRASIVVARTGQQHAQQVRAVGEALFGTPATTGGVWLWDVRPIVAGA